MTRMILNETEQYGRQTLSRGHRCHQQLDVCDCAERDGNWSDEAQVHGCQGLTEWRYITVARWNVVPDQSVSK